MIPDFTLIDPSETRVLRILYITMENELWYSYSQLYEFWLISEKDESLKEKILKPKLPYDDSLNMNDFISLGTSLACFGYIG